MWVIECLCRLFPSSRILFVVARASDVEPLQRRLDRIRQQLGLSVSGRELGFEVISQQWYRWLWNVDSIWNLQVFLDETPANPGVFGNYDMWLMCRRYAVLQPRQRSAAEQYVIEALVGPVILDLTKSSEELRALAIWLPKDGPKQNAFYANALERKRERIWGDAQRNQTLAELARAFRNHDRQGLARLERRNFDLESWYQQNRNLPRVAILTESWEHAESLGRLLEGWDVVGKDAGMPTEVRTVLKQGHSMIITMMAAHEYGFDADVIIRADGTNTPFNKDWINRRPRDFRKPTLIIDLDERFDRAARQATAKRRALYRSW